jgi:cysteinyl-tRNA synthetase
MNTTRNITILLACCYSSALLQCIESFSVLQQAVHHSKQHQRQKLQRVRHLCMSSKPSSKNTSETNSKGEVLKLYNSLTRSKEPFQSIQPNTVSMYTCGPTVYDYAHVGNFRAFLTYDIIKRTLSYFGYNVDHICNLTDVDDKIIKKCTIENKSLLEITRKYEELFLDDLHALNIIPARCYPRATEHIDEMVSLIQDLEEKGLAYQSEEGSWYFNVAKKEGYGQQLVNLDVNNMKSNASGLAGAQRTTETSNTTTSDDDDIDADEYDADKVGVRDFALWKAYKPNFDREDAIWNTPIGKGRPGWHLECSAMAKKYLGESIDIHCGGIDLKFPHHENEIAQSEGASGKKFCSCWLHNGFVNIGDEKMSKSKGNFLTLRGACPSSMDVRAYRYLVVSSQYRNPLSFTEEAMKAAKGALSRLDAIMKLLNDALSHNNEVDDNKTTTENSNISSIVSKELQNFEAALSDDVNMPRASASLFAVIKTAEGEFKRLKKQEKDLKDDVNTSILPLDLEGLESARNALLQMDQIFGLLYTVPPAKGEDGKLIEEEPEEDDVVPDEVLELVKSRSAAKDAKDWELADSLRSRITELGFAVKDVKGGDPIISRI